MKQVVDTFTHKLPTSTITYLLLYYFQAKIVHFTKTQATGNPQLLGSQFQCLIELGLCKFKEKIQVSPKLRIKSEIIIMISDFIP